MMELPTEDFERLGAEIKRLEGLVEGRDVEIERLNKAWDEERQWREELSDLSIDQRVEIERLRVELTQERKEREVMAEQRDQAVPQLDALRAENEEYASQITTLEWSLSEANKEIERLRAVVAEVRKLEAVDHGVAWPDLCHALYELDRSNCC